LLHRYGAAALQLLGRLGGDTRDAERIVPELQYRRLEITRAAETEMAMTLDDVLRRRVPLSFRHSDGGAGAAADAGALVGAALGWNAEETASEVARYRTGVADELRRRAEPAAPPDVAVDSRRRA
jgi:glycerol-3-phosphate dehydrogenase